MLKIGDIELNGLAILAPLAGVGNYPFRLICREYGAALVSSEMMSCHGLMRNQPNTIRMLYTQPKEKPLAFQLFGADPKVMAAASQKAAASGADLVDLNFGCPAPKVVRHRGGSSLLREPQVLEEIVSACVQACPRPVTVKIRIGWDENHINAVEIARRAETAGAAAITVHGRTVKQRFSGKADWEIIRQVVEAVKIPVIGNGDIRTGPEAAAMLAQTKCSGIMVGRGAMGRPWVFEKINHYLKTGKELAEPDLAERIPIIRRHYQGLIEVKNERTARLEMRKHIAWYLSGLPGAAEIRRQVNTCETKEELDAILDKLED
jgi:tRNA-dihydrouridine synthase B